VQVELQILDYQCIAMMVKVYCAWSISPNDVECGIDTRYHCVVSSWQLSLYVCEMEQEYLNPNAQPH